MVVAPEKVDAYLQKKGIPPRMTDAEWASVIEHLKPLFANGRWYQVKLLHQGEDPLRRFSASFPDSIPVPYRFIDYIQFAAGGAVPDAGVVSTLESRRIPFAMAAQPNGPEEDDLVTIIRVGPRA